MQVFQVTPWIFRFPATDTPWLLERPVLITEGDGIYRIIVEVEDSLGFKAMWDAKVVVQ